VRKCVLNVRLKFHDDPTVNESSLLGQVWMYVGKIKGFDFGKEKRKNKFERKKERNDLS